MTVRTVSTSLEGLTRHVAIASRLADYPIPDVVRGAANGATVAAYLLAATEAECETAHSSKVSALRDFVKIVEPAHAPFRSALIDAALAAEVDARGARGAPIYGRRLRGWMDPPADAPPRSRPASPAAGTAVMPALPDSVAQACVEAVTLGDVDAVLPRMLELTRSLRVAAARGEPRGALLDAYEAAALGLCVRPAAHGVDDARWLILHTWGVLRRRRPLAAAVIRARVRWTRTARPPSHDGPA